MIHLSRIEQNWDVGCKHLSTGCCDNKVQPKVMAVFNVAKQTFQLVLMIPFLFAL